MELDDIANMVQANTTDILEMVHQGEYVWELPFVVGVSKGLAITNDSAVELAKDIGTEISYDDLTKTAYHRYTSDREFVVRFRDSRTIVEYLYFVNELGLKGISV